MIQMAETIPFVCNSLQWRRQEFRRARERISYAIDYHRLCSQPESKPLRRRFFYFIHNGNFSLSLVVLYYFHTAHVLLSTVQELKAARSKGFTVPEISEQFKLPKSTLWRLTNSVFLSPETRKQIQSRRGGSTTRFKQRQLVADKEAERILKKLSVRSSLPIILSALYWAEGTKSSFVFTNTDSQMIRVFPYILRKCFLVSDDRLQIMLRFGSTMNSEENTRYWSEVTGIPKKRISLNINSKYNKTTTKHGLCRITVSKGAQLLKVVTAINKKLTVEVLKS